MNKATSSKVRGIVLGILGLILTTGALQAQSTLIISEYIEGSSNNKAIELYNGTGADIDLSTVEMYRANNGSATWQDTLSLSGILADGDFYLIANPSADAALLDKSDTTSTITFYNGDDALALAVNGTIIDVIGELGVDPGTAWDVAGVTGATNEQSLLRKTSVTAGNTDWAASAGTNATDSEWIVRDQDDFSNFGFDSDTNPVNVTFRVNMATALDTVNANSYTVHINGAVKGAYAGQAFLGGETISWDANATATLENVGGDYWEGTYQLAEGDTLLYKYRYFNTATNGTDDENGFATTNNPAGWDTRGMVASQDTVLDLAFYNDRSDNPEPGTLQPWENKADSVAIWFRVNVGRLVQESNFDPTTDSIQVRGGQAPLTWDAATAVVLSYEGDAAGDNEFYSGVGYFPIDSLNTAAFAPDGQPNPTIKYKYFAYGPNANVDWESSSDRFFNFSPNDTTVHGQSFNQTPPSQATIVNTNLNFEVNVGILEGLGFFNSSIDTVQVRGTFNSWSSDNIMDFNSFTGTYEESNVPLTAAVGSEVKYKYFIRWDDRRDEETSEFYLPEIRAADQGWEEPGVTGGADRVITVEDSPSQATVSEFYNGVEPEALINEANVETGAISVTFRVNMAPALGFTSDPFDPASDSVYLYIDTPFFALTNGIVVAGDNGENFITQTAEEIEALRFTDPDGDDVYELELPLNTTDGTLNHIGFRIAYGSALDPNGELLVNGGGFDAGRRHYQYIQPMVASDGTVTWPSSYTFPVLDWKRDNLPFELPPDYQTVSNEDESVDQADQFSLSQNYPNPFNPTTNIQFSLATASDVTLTVYNVIGQRVATLLSSQKMSSGTHTVGFDASSLSSGVYFYRLQAGNFVTQKSMTLIK
ncbi:lamin tail domain-containing protein [Balneola sp. MJW-20]|uniref:lamin tail domain-containing protein n=1 Tax=Gracilimonas aurantiaca TaxID=3234185 RepID=UPI0034674411